MNLNHRTKKIKRTRKSERLKKKDIVYIFIILIITANKSKIDIHFRLQANNSREVLLFTYES